MNTVHWFQARQTRRFLSRALVVFACDPADAAKVDVALGPCQPRFGPRGGRLRPYALRSSQSYSTTFEQLTCLYSILTARPPTEAVTQLLKAGPGTMGRLTDQFVEVLSAIRARSLASFNGGGEPFQIENEIGQRWMTSVRWPRAMRVGGLGMKIFQWSVECETATKKNLSVFVWEGPAVPERVIVHGTSFEEYETYRKARRKAPWP